LGRADSTTSQCLSALLGPAREIEVCPRRPQMGKHKPVHLSLSYDHCPVNQHSWVTVQLTQQQLEAEMKSTLGGTARADSPTKKIPVPRGPVPFKKKKHSKRETLAPERSSAQVFSMANHLLNLIFKPVDPWIWPGFDLLKVWQLLSRWQGVAQRGGGERWGVRP